MVDGFSARQLEAMDVEHLERLLQQKNTTGPPKQQKRNPTEHQVHAPLKTENAALDAAEEECTGNDEETFCVDVMDDNVTSGLPAFFAGSDEPSVVLAAHSSTLPPALKGSLPKITPAPWAPSATERTDSGSLKDILREEEEKKRREEKERREKEKLRQQETVESSLRTPILLYRSYLYPQTPHTPYKTYVSHIHDARICRLPVLLSTGSILSSAVIMIPLQYPFRIFNLSSVTSHHLCPPSRYCSQLCDVVFFARAILFLT